MAKLATRMLRTLAVALAAVGLAAGIVPAAHAATPGQVSTYNAAAVLSSDGQLAVQAAITFESTPPERLQQVIQTARRTAQSTEYRYTISDVTLSSGGVVLQPEIRTEASRVIIDMPTAGLTQPLLLSYVVTGAAVRDVDDETLVSWPLLQGLSVPVRQFNGVMSVPTLFTYLDCAAGEASSPESCTFYAGGNHDYPQPTFRQDGVGIGDVVIATLSFAPGQVAVNENLRQLWTAERAFSVDPLALGLAVGVAVLGALLLWLAHRKIGRDFAGAVDPILVADFEPIAAGQTEFTVIEGIRPGTIGTLVDERVDPVDVTASVLDLAVRGHLRITELPRENEHAPTDWTFTRRSSDEPLHDFERTLLDAVAPVQGDPVKLSHLPGTLASVIGTVQSELYDEVVAEGWFARRPDATRSQWGLLSWVVLVAATVGAATLIAFTSFGLLGLSLVLVALGLMFVSREMPARTATGTAVLRGLDILRGDLLTHPVSNLTADDPYRSVSTLLPYAVVLGGRDRWLTAIAQSDADGLPDSADLDWYHGPQDWHLADFPASMNNFVTTLQGTLFSR
ncbi:MAG TPA: hypothetical protein DCM67_02335 [Propionibacteriaceae bacterium]|nr:hypothetical protein [Propionibacteriaceae bacterium]